MENKNIPDAQITASSEYNNSTRAFYGRLNLEAEGGNAGAWSARYDDYNQWLQVDLGNKTQVTGIKTQGQEHDTCQWVKSYTISYSNDGIKFTAYKQNVVCKKPKLTFVKSIWHPSPWSYCQKAWRLWWRLISYQSRYELFKWQTATCQTEWTTLFYENYNEWCPRGINFGSHSL